jgi:hypothetical protein
MEIFREAVRANKKLVIAANMNLTASETEQFWQIYEE